jgi:hypothetical protein
MGAIKVKAQSTQGTQSRLARAQPRAKAADPGGFTSRPGAPSSNGHCLGLGRRSPPRPTPGLGLNLNAGRRTPTRSTQGSDSASTSEDGLRLTRPRARTQPRPRKTVSASPDPGLGLNLDLGRRTPPRPTPGLGLSLDLGRRTRPRPRRSLRLARPRARTDHVTGWAIITLPLASSGYGEQDRRPIWLAPVNK